MSKKIVIEYSSINSEYGVRVAIEEDGVIRKGVVLQTKDDERLISQVSIYSYKFFVEAFFPDLSPDDIINGIIDKDLEETYPFKKLFWRIWLRKNRRI